jgi:hypothetical protein
MSVLSGVVLVGGVAMAQPTGGAPAPTPAPATGSGAAEGSAVAPIEDAPPGDMEGRDENPDAPRSGDEPTGPVGPVAPPKKSGYPVEEVLRPITLPQNMGEVSIAPHFQVSPFTGSDALRFRFGITPKVQLGLTYLYAGAYDEDPMDLNDKTTFHAGKAGGLDVTVLVQNWIGVKVGVPVYLDPFAISFAAGAPMKFVFGKVAIGGMEDVINITLHEFPPSLYREDFNAEGSRNKTTGSQQSRGRLRFSGYAAYQQSTKLALIGRLGLDRDLGAGGGGAAGTSTVDTTETFLRAGVQFSPRRFIDVGASAGFDNLAKAGSFGLSGFFALRI